MTLLCYNVAVKVNVYAKLNLTLNVGAKQGEFHSIDSMATSVDVCDVVEVVKRLDKRINVCGVQEVEKELNTAYKAAEAFVRVFGQVLSGEASGVDIFIQKGIPFGGGLGGSGADAAAVVYCMCKLFGVDIRSRKIHELCAMLGSDVNFMLFGGLGRMQGKGDDVTFYKQVKPLYFALTSFEQSMSSGKIYSAFDALPICKHVDNEFLLKLMQQGEHSQAISMFSNDLQPATMKVDNYAKDYLNFIKAHNLLCNMTGSGSAYYVACVTMDEANRVTELLNAHGFVTRVCKSVPSGIVEI